MQRQEGKRKEERIGPEQPEKKEPEGPAVQKSGR